MNDKLFKILNQFSGRTPFIDSLMIILSNKIRYLFIFVLIIMWVRNKFYKKVALYAILSAGLTLIINPLIKLFYYKSRPFLKSRVGILIPSKTDSTFPSKHTLLTFAISTTIFIYERVLGTFMWILSVLTGFSRIWVGHHYPIDIVGSAIIATITSLVVDRAAHYLKN
ncbi:undecaprenyl-diphosphatase [Calidifontibacillus oryziterrae]|uniref:undecaprenyl-diphosphatase n=1 Tax=Calidifontibacillus oryziterrae TaxID=1191699 RepID=UPI0002EEAA9B|nr:undecaprenyl-diphosphatase [Calidifontibacillus oryziterrae]